MARYAQLESRGSLLKTASLSPSSRIRLRKTRLGPDSVQ
jgi:hypothetical protein